MIQNRACMYICMYSCQNLVTDKIEDYHVTRLREFRYDERYFDPRDIALRDRDERVLCRKDLLGSS